MTNGLSVDWVVVLEWWWWDVVERFSPERCYKKTFHSVFGASEIIWSPQDWTVQTKISFRNSARLVVFSRFHYQTFGRKHRMNIEFNIKYWWCPEAAELNSLHLLSLFASVKRMFLLSGKKKTCSRRDSLCLQLQRGRVIGRACHDPDTQGWPLQSPLSDPSQHLN